jgi:hypothetical protein
MSPVGIGATAHDAPVHETDDDTGEQTGEPTRGPSPRLVIAGLLALIGLPLVVAAIALRRPHWFPVLDLAMTELRLRDVGTRHTPLIGLPGRIGPSLAEQGSHPGPLSFYLLTPVYRVFGSTAWAMQAATAVLNLVALGVALLIAGRRGGRRLVLGVAALAALLISGYGVATLTEPWNPYMPLLWWLVLLLAVWSVTCRDVVMLPVAVFAGSLCAQTHVPYVALALGVGVVAVVAAALAWQRGPAGSDVRRRVVRWSAVALVLGVVLWTPPLVDQAINDPGNLRRIYDHMATPTEDPVGPRQGIELALVHLNVFHFVTGDSGADGSLVDASSDPDGSIVPGLAVLAMWAAAAVTAARIRHQALMRLHLVIAAGLVLGAVSMSRIFGKVWFYLMQWAWGVAALLILAVAWTAFAAVSPRLSADRRRRLVGAGTAGLLAVALSATAVTTVAALDVDPPAPNLSSTLGQVLPPTVAALERGEGAATGRDGRYVVTWSDAFYFGSQGYGVVSELERAGFEAAAAPPWHVPITGHRVVEPAETTAVVHLATGLFVERWRAVPGAAEVAYVEPRSPAELDEYSRLRSEVVADLRADGLDEVVPIVDSNLFGVSIDERVSKEAQRRMARMLELGQETAIFIVPPGTTL